MSIQTYNDVPYGKQAHNETHISNLEAISTLCGMTPVPITNCRVLEIGCAEGWNLLPQTEQYPNSEFVGMDFCLNQIKVAQEVIDKLGLKNATMRCDNIMDIDESWGKYDYILCHGIYSWVPFDVQKRILEICKMLLTPNGVAQISYNIFPGWHFRCGLREIMLYHIESQTTPTEKIHEAREILKFIHKESPNKPYKVLLDSIITELATGKDSYLYHDYLEDDNHPIYFHEFIQRITDNQLQYVGNAELSSMFIQGLSKSVRENFKTLNRIQLEQYKDFLFNSTFRNTIICHDNITLEEMSNKKIDGFHLRLKEKCKIDDKLAEKVPEVYKLLEKLNKEWPESVSVEDVDIAANACVTGLVDIIRRPTAITNIVTERPMVSPLTRLQVSYGSLVNQLHCNFNVDDFTGFIINELDGSKTVKDLANSVHQALKDGVLQLSDRDEKLTSKMLIEPIKAVLESMCELGFFIK